MFAFFFTWVHPALLQRPVYVVPVALVRHNVERHDQHRQLHQGEHGAHALRHQAEDLQRQVQRAEAK